MADNKTIGEKLRAMEERANKEQAEGPRENANRERGGGVSNREQEEERREQHSVPPRGASKERGRA